MPKQIYRFHRNIIKLVLKCCNAKLYKGEICICNEIQLDSVLNSILDNSISKQEYKYKYDIDNVINNLDILRDYITDLNTHLTLNPLLTTNGLLNYARHICSGLPIEEQLLTNLKININKCDKGIYGKMIEYGFFGQLPNSYSSPDLVKSGYDIKSCAFKCLKNKRKNAKERQTITNCGNTNNYETFKDICENEKLQDSKYFKKMKQFILFIRDDDKKQYKTLDQLLNQPMLLIVWFEIEKLPIGIQDIIHEDYAKIRQCIFEKSVSQKGQQYLHIHPHGSGHGSGTRALGFTNKFITLIVAMTVSDIYKKNVEDIIIRNGNSISIKEEYL